MHKAEVRIDNQSAFGSIWSLSGEERTIWNHSSGWPAMIHERNQEGARLTFASIIGLKFVFFEEKLIVDIG
jgi:hypothetical protein